MSAFNFNNNGSTAGRPMQEPLSSLYQRNVQSTRPWATEQEFQDKGFGGMLQGGGTPQQMLRQPSQPKIPKQGQPSTGQQPGQQQQQGQPRQQQRQAHPQFSLAGHQNPFKAGGALGPSGHDSQGLGLGGSRGQASGQQEVRDFPRPSLQPTLRERLQSKTFPEGLQPLQQQLQQPSHQQMQPQQQQPQQQPQQQKPQSAAARLDKLVKQGAEKNRLRKIATPQAAPTPQAAEARLPTPGLKGGIDSARASGPADSGDAAPKSTKVSESKSGPAGAVQGGAGQDSDEDSAEAVQCDPPPKPLQSAPEAQGRGMRIDSLAASMPPSKSLQVPNTKRRSPQQAAPSLEQAGEAASLHGSSAGEDSKAAPQAWQGASEQAAAPQFGGQPLPKRVRANDPPEAATQSSESVPVAATAPDAAMVDAAEPAASLTQSDTAEDKAISDSGAFVCEVLDARPEKPLDLVLLDQMAAKRRRTRSPSAGSDHSQAASQQLPSHLPAPPSPSLVAAAAKGSIAAALKGVVAELRAMEEVEEAQALLQQLPEELTSAVDGFDAQSEDHCQNLSGICRERLPRWLLDMDRLERRLSRDWQESKDAEKQGRPEEVLRLSRQAGAAFSRAIQQVMDGTPSGTATMEGALTLEEELAEFAHDASEGRCGLVASRPGRQHTVSAGDAAQAAADLWDAFGDVQGYAAYLEKVVRVAGADVHLSGGAAWHRLMAELEVAMRLVHLHPEHLEGLDGMALQLQGARVLGGQGWEDMAQKLMHCLALGPLQSRARYVVVRVAWALRRQKLAAGAWLRTMGKGPVGWLYSSVPQQWQLLESNPQVRDLVFGAVDSAAAAATAPLLNFFEAAICSGCQSPQLLLRPHTQCDLQLFAASAQRPASPVPHGVESQASSRAPASARSQASPRAPDAARASQTETEEKEECEGPEPPLSARASETEGEEKPEGENPEPTPGARSRVLAEVRQRFAAAPRLPAGGLCTASEGDWLRLLLGRSFRVLRSTLVGHVLSFAGTALAAFTNRGLDEAVGTIGFQPRERRALESEHRRIEAAALRTQERLAAVQRWSRILRSARAGGF